MDAGPLWKCSKCRRFFANPNQSHFCSRYTLREHLTGKSQHAITLFQEFTRLVKRCGPVRVVPEKTRIAFQVRMSFAAVSLRRDRIVGHIVLARRLENPRFTKIECISPRSHVHSFCFHTPEELDTRFSPGSVRLTELASNATYRCEREGLWQPGKREHCRRS